MVHSSIKLTLLVMWSVCGLAACGSMSTWKGTHAGVHYEIHKDHRDHRIVRGKEGRLEYDSPELTVVADSGQLEINGQDAGPLNPGDHVEVTDLGTVLVNGTRRGDRMTGHAEMKERLSLAKQLMDAHAADRNIATASHEK